MSHASLILLFVFSVFVAEAAAPPSSAEFRGYTATNRTLSERLIERGHAFQGGVYLGEQYNPMTLNLLDLVGTYKSGSAGERFKNGVPNSLNMLLWHLMLSGLSGDVSKICSGENAREFRIDFQERVRALCSWPAGASRADAVLFDYWLATMGYDAPLTEYQVWKEFALGPAMADFQGAEAVEWLTLSILNNPYFLLRH